MSTDPAAQTLWYRQESAPALARLGVDPAAGLAGSEAEARLAEHGENRLLERAHKPAWRLFLDQLENTLVAVLLVAAGIAAMAGNLKDTIAILAIVLLNAVLGFVQEYRAERSIAALKQLAVPKVRVRRDNAMVEVASVLLVPGDIVLLEAGNLVPADGRVLEAASLKAQESILTGESEAVEKQAAAIPGEQPIALGDQANMVFMGTTVTYGRGQVVVTATGMQTELGRVAELLQGVGQVKTPLQARLDQLGKVIAVAALVVVAAIFGFGVMAGEDWKLMLMTSISMAVAIIPEGLPTVVTIALALGAQRMLKRHALIRRLPAVETLGSVTVICSDKTGTLTENKMTAVALDLAGHRLDISESIKHRAPTIELSETINKALVKEEPALALLLMGGALCSDAQLEREPGQSGRFRALGDPTEAALVVAAAKHGLLKGPLEAAFPRFAEVPFDSDRKRMSTLHRLKDRSAWIGEATEEAPDQCLVFTKGATDSLLKVCTQVWEHGRSLPLDASWRDRIARANDDLAQGGMRVLGVAFRLAHGVGKADAVTATALEDELVFIGMIGILDPPRPEVKKAVATCRAAGIRPVMITGDHPATARRIAQDLGILGGGQTVTGTELQALSQEQLDELVPRVSVFARVAPDQKLSIVESLQRQGQVVAMTGDGVNDAPSLRRADIGVAMGITGTDVSKEAASMVLLDDNFSSIVAAVEEGRSINDNIRRFIKFSLAGNIGKVLLVFLGPLLGMPLPLLPFQILWLNLVTDGILGLGISVEPAERGTMDRPPQTPSAGILSGGLGAEIAWLGALMGLLNLGVAYWAYASGQAAWQTIAMLNVVLLQIVQAYVSRSSGVPVFAMDPFTNPALLLATVSVVLLQAMVVYLPQLHGLFGTAPLTAHQMLVPLLAALILVIVAELAKWLGRPRKP